ncbi:unnamed protein product [Sphagnum troendelagicum]|uniref:G domain-containing protein n=1 Tax=Sphagnum troendelagicum TaxID=128251 RepID=A0ABP0T8S5_9BRYO
MACLARTVSSSRLFPERAMYRFLSTGFISRFSRKLLQGHFFTSSQGFYTSTESNPSRRASQQGGVVVECSSSLPSEGQFSSQRKRSSDNVNKLACPGCGIYMQDTNPKAPGFFKMPAALEKLSNEEEEEEEEGRRNFEEAESDIKDEEDEEKLVVCARCHALRNYGKVKDETLENLLPDFDFERVVGVRLKKAYGRRAVVVMVVDGCDFDGSFPRKVAAVLAETEQEMGTAWQEGRSGNVPRLLLVVNKLDLFPHQVSPNRLEQWVRRRSKAGGAPRLTGVHLVSAFKGWGVENLARHLQELAGPRGDVWVVGAQNAGKSSLINSLAKVTAQGNKKALSHLTEAPVPGTTLGILKLDNILPAKARLFDTPGLLHPHQITTRLTHEEQKLVQVRKQLRPRTFRVKKGYTVHVGGLLRLDVVETPAESIYMTVWASAQVPCHMGKAEGAEELLEKHLGERLKPPMDKERVAEMGEWLARKVTVSGDAWDASSVDLAVAGLGWIGIGVKGTAVLQAWTYEGVAVTTHEAMVFDMAREFEKPGFTAVKSPGKAKKKSSGKETAKNDRVKEVV